MVVERRLILPLQLAACLVLLMVGIAAPQFLSGPSSASGATSCSKYASPSGSDSRARREIARNAMNHSVEASLDFRLGRSSDLATPIRTWLYHDLSLAAGSNQRTVDSGLRAMAREQGSRGASR